MKRAVALVLSLAALCSADEFDDARARAENISSSLQRLESSVQALDSRLLRLETIESRLSEQHKILGRILELVEDDVSPPPVNTDVLVSPGQSINDAIASAAPGVAVVLRAGTYRQLISPRRGNFTLRGDGEVIIAPTSGARCAEFAYLEASDITVRNLIFDGLGVEHECVKLDWRGPDPRKSSQRVTFEDCVFRNGPHNGVLTVGPSRGHRFIRCRATNNGFAPSNTGVGAGHGFYFSSSDIQAIDCEADGNKGWGVHPFVQDPQAHGTGRLVDIVIRGLRSHGNGWYGAGLYRGDGLLIEQSSFWKNGRGGVEVGLGTRGSIVRANSFYRGNGLRFTGEDARGANQGGVSDNRQIDRESPE